MRSGLTSDDRRSRLVTHSRHAIVRRNERRRQKSAGAGPGSTHLPPPRRTTMPTSWLARTVQSGQKSVLPTFRCRRAQSLPTGPEPAARTRSGESHSASPVGGTAGDPGAATGHDQSETTNGSPALRASIRADRGQLGRRALVCGSHQNGMPPAGRPRLSAKQSAIQHVTGRSPNRARSIRVADPSVDGSLAAREGDAPSRPARRAGTAHTLVCCYRTVGCSELPGRPPGATSSPRPR